MFVCTVDLGAENLIAEPLDLVVIEEQALKFNKGRKASCRNGRMTMSVQQSGFGIEASREARGGFAGTNKEGRMDIITHPSGYYSGHSGPRQDRAG